jgi:uncharacterized LabA/DUF88 family protein
MKSTSEIHNTAVFCDFENIALGAREAKYDKFDIRKVLERLLLKNNIVVKKAYCDWDRYKTFKKAMHEAAFELIEIPHVRMSGKNSADIRMVVDALDLCYTKSHVSTFVIISGDSDFSPLVSKLRENNKTVVGIGVKNSTSDLFIDNCDEFIFYDDLVREKPAKKRPVTRKSAISKSAKPLPAKEEKLKEEPLSEALALVMETYEALSATRTDEDAIWGSMIKQAIKRQRPGFNESYHGYRSFNKLLEDARDKGLLKLTEDEKSGGYIVRTGSE